MLINAITRKKIVQRSENNSFWLGRKPFLRFFKKLLLFIIYYVFVWVDIHAMVLMEVRG